jgi:hypothetical protein
LGTKGYGIDTIDTKIDLDGLKDLVVNEEMGVKSKLSKVRKMDPYFEHFNSSGKYQPRNQMNKTATSYLGRESPDGIRSTRVDSD